ncbi:MAG: hypothetical protein M0P61_08570 [Ignavibacteriaceae bacterium]|jgi:hypothetical protein|nr:hypothetical protein [Ignavibacteriaceae bacterium]
MKHYDENIIELFILGDKKVEEERKEFEEHLKECFSCRELYLEMQSYYEAISANNKFLEKKSELAQGSSLQVSPYFSKKNEVIRPSIPRTLPQRVWFFTANHPVKTTFALFASFCAVALVMNSYNFFQPKNPQLERINDKTHSLEVFNKNNQLLWQIPWNGSIDWEKDEEEFNINLSVVDDINDDGNNELLTVIPTIAGSNDRSDQLIIFNKDGSINQRVKVGHAISFRDKKYIDDFTTIGLIVLKNNKGEKEIFVGAKHRNSPFVLSRIDKNGNILGEYWHYGHIWGMNTTTTNGTDQKIILAGCNDITDKAALIVLNPEEIKGKIESRYGGGFGCETNKAEENYFTYTNEELGKTYQEPRFYKIKVDKNNIVASFRFAEESATIIDILFNKKLEPLEIKPTDETRGNLERLNVQPI